MKKLLSILIALIFAISFVGCITVEERKYTQEDVDRLAEYLEDFYELYTEMKLAEQKVKFYEEFLDEYKAFAEAKIEAEVVEEILYLESKIKALRGELEALEDVFDYAVDKGMLTDEELLVLRAYWEQLQGGN